MRILVLGGTRFIGRAVVDALADRHHVTVANRGTQRLWRDDVAHTVFDRELGTSLVSVLDVRQFDAVVDVSGTEPAHISHVTRGWPADWKYLPYIFISSGGVYDRSVKPPPFSEDMPTPGAPIWGTYGVAKADCEELLRAEFPQLTCLRPPYVYGPFNYEDRERWLWARLFREKPILIPRDGSARLQFCHTELLARVVGEVLTGEVPAGTYNIGEPTTYSIVEYLELLASVAGRQLTTQRVLDGRSAREFFPFRDADLTLVTDKLASHTRIDKPELEEGLRNTLTWCHANDPLAYVPTQSELELFARN